MGVEKKKKRVDTKRRSVYTPVEASYPLLSTSHPTLTIERFGLSFTAIVAISQFIIALIGTFSTVQQWLVHGTSICHRHLNHGHHKEQ
jgi:hypothetical protein